ncbi:hypothetical protein AZJ51_10990, partial [Streptococcus pneumoniae]
MRRLLQVFFFCPKQIYSFKLYQTLIFYKYTDAFFSVKIVSTTNFGGHIMSTTIIGFPRLGEFLELKFT